MESDTPDAQPQLPDETAPLEVPEAAPPPPSPRPAPRSPAFLWMVPAAILVLGYIGLGRPPAPATPPQPPALGSPLDAAWHAYRDGDSAQARKLAEQALAEAHDPRATAEAQSLLALTQAQDAAAASPTPEPSASGEPTPTSTPTQPSPTPIVKAPPVPAIAQAPAPAVIRPAMPPAPKPYPKRHPLPVASPTPDDEDAPEVAPDATPVAAVAAPVPPPADLFEPTRALDRVLQHREVEAIFVGTGVPSQILDVRLTNRKGVAQHLDFLPGMMLVAERDPAVPSMVLSDEVSVLLGPNETRTVKLRAYALDGVALPGDGREVDYKLKSVKTSRALRLLAAARTAPVHTRLSDSVHRRAMTQLAIWQASGVSLDNGRFQTALGLYARDLWARDAVMADVASLLASTR